MRLAVPGDAPGLGALHVRAWQEAYRGVMPAAFLAGLSPAERAGWWASAAAAPAPGCRLWVAEGQGAAGPGPLLGFAFAGPPRRAPAPGVLELYALNVDPPFHRQGAGRALVAAVTAWATGCGAAAAVLWVVRENQRAQAFYRAQGWAPDGASEVSEVGGARLEELRFRRPLG